MSYKDKQKQKEYQRQYFLNNKELYYKRNQESVQRIYDWINKIKSGPCTDCHQKFPSVCMDFDHLDRKTKINNVATLVRMNNFKKVKEEISKCELVCSNCHRIRTYIKNC